MEIVGIIALIILCLLAFSLFGWVLKILGWVLDFLGEGCSTSWGCLIWVIALVVCLVAVL